LLYHVKHYIYNINLFGQRVIVNFIFFENKYPLAKKYDIV